VIGNSETGISAEMYETIRLSGLLKHPDAKLTPLTGGVSSEIIRVEDGDDSFVVKRALSRLRVKDDWTADVNRNDYEQMYIEYVARFLPEAVPALRPGPMGRGYFVMEFLGAEFASWKQRLLLGEIHSEDAVAAATMLARIHAHSAEDAEAARKFDTTKNFIQLRIAPYLLTTGQRNPDLRGLFEDEAQRLASTRESLVHGDFSPKNIMISTSRMVLLDCEVAWYGDPAFDLAFLLTHLLLKGLFHAPRQIGLREMCRAFWQRYAEEAGGSINPRILEPRVARLVLMLLLARIDGKSPVEYLPGKQQAEYLRRFARSGIQSLQTNLIEILEQWFGDLEKWEVR
jgi:aminoglycoside phosphotransferase (APT) family kinase protein